MAVDDSEAEIEGEEAGNDPDFIGVEAACEHISFGRRKGSDGGIDSSGDEVDDNQEVEEEAGRFHRF